ncbi:MAG: low temperature requirement protein A [Chloroflexi bacterium]|nr:low temperature requirement protein A [Chloroflexota bacterium]
MLSISGIFRLHISKTEHAEGQRVGWLELFFDLVYVATVIALGDRLSNDISLEGVLSFAALFIPTWWTWTGTAFYITRFNLDDVGHRLLIFAQMFAVAILAINIHDGLAETSQGFALGYVGARLCLIFMYLRAGRQRPRARQLTTRYATGFALAALIWFVSVFVPEPARFFFWIAGMVIDFGTPLLPSTRRLQAENPPDTHHLPERFGLFTIIVLGEAFIKVITHASEEEHLKLANALYGGLALITAASLWWIYFDNIKGSVVRRTQFAGQVWVYMHLPLVASITAFGVASKKIVLLEAGHDLHNEEHLLAAGAVSLALIAIAILDLATTETTQELTDNQVALMRLGSAIVILIVGLAGPLLGAGGLLGVIALACAIQVVADVYRYARVPSAGDPHAKTPDSGY